MGLPFSFIACLCLLPALCLTAAWGQTVIFRDLNSSFTTALQANAVTDSGSHSTDQPGFIVFTVLWNGDAQDAFEMTASTSQLSLVPLTDVGFCSPSAATSPPYQIAFNATTVSQCSFSAGWTSPFNGQLTLLYIANSSLQTAEPFEITVLFLSPSSLPSASSSSSSPSPLSPSSRAPPLPSSSSIPSVSNSTVIFQVYTEGSQFSTVLPSSSSASGCAAVSTSVEAVARGPVTLTFGLSWNGDEQDIATIRAPSTLNLTALNAASFCTPSGLTSPPYQIQFNSTTVSQCNYSLSFQPTGAVLTIVYSAGLSTGVLDLGCVSITVFTPEGPPRGGDTFLNESSTGVSPVVGGEMSFIFQDWNSGFSLALPSSSGVEQDRPAYSTAVGGSFSFATSWNVGDVEDTVFITVPPQLTVSAANAVSFCSTFDLVSSGVAFSSSSVLQCNYTASWTTAFSGALTVTYNSVPQEGASICTVITVFFTAAALPVSSSSAPPAPQVIFKDYSSGWTYSLPSLTEASAIDTMIYFTEEPGSLIFGVSWNGDEADLVVVRIPGDLSLSAAADNSFCSPNANGTSQHTILFTPAAAVKECFYTVGWIDAFDGLMAINYTAGLNTTQVQSVSIMVRFEPIRPFVLPSSSSSPPTVSPSSSLFPPTPSSTGAGSTNPGLFTRASSGFSPATSSSSSSVSSSLSPSSSFPSGSTGGASVSSGSNTETGIIVGVVVGTFCLVALCAAIVNYKWRHSHQTSDEKDKPPPYPGGPLSPHLTPFPGVQKVPEPGVELQPQSPAPESMVQVRRSNVVFLH